MRWIKELFSDCANPEKGKKGVSAVNPDKVSWARADANSLMSSVPQSDSLVDRFSIFHLKNDDPLILLIYVEDRPDITNPQTEVVLSALDLLDIMSL